MFVGRENELESRRLLLDKRTSSLVASRGRRRIGKSTLFVACIAASVACAQTAAERPAPRRALWERIVSGPEDRGTTKCAAYLTKLYLSSVGNAATMNIGIAPNREGILDADDVKALAGFGVMRKALFAREARPFNVVVMKEDVSKGEHVDGWRVLADGREILRGRSVGMKRIRLLTEPVAAGKCEVGVTAGGGKVELRRYIADADLVKTVLEADADSGETDTAKWMTGAAASH